MIWIVLIVIVAAIVVWAVIAEKNDKKRQAERDKKNREIANQEYIKFADKVLKEMDKQCAATEGQTDLSGIVIYEGVLAVTSAPWSNAIAKWTCDYLTKKNIANVTFSVEPVSLPNKAPRYAIRFKAQREYVMEAYGRYLGKYATTDVAYAPISSKNLFTEASQFAEHLRKTNYTLVSTYAGYWTSHYGVNVDDSRQEGHILVMSKETAYYQTAAWSHNHGKIMKETEPTVTHGPYSKFDLPALSKNSEIYGLAIAIANASPKDSGKQYYVYETKAEDGSYAVKIEKRHKYIPYKRPTW